VRIGVFHGSPYYLRYYESALVALHDRGHRLLLARPDRYDDVWVPKSLRGSRRVETALHPFRRADGLDQPVRILRATRDFARYSAPPLVEAHANRDRAYERMLRSVIGKQRSLEHDGPPPPVSVDRDTYSAVDSVFRELEALVPADDGVAGFLRESKLDVVVVVARVNLAARDTEVVKAAMELGIPTGIVVYSWDNLSSKGLVHVQPDALFVWNDVQAREAEELHGIPADRVVVTGAVRFDSVFDRAPSAPRAELLGELGLDPGRKTVLYLGSSAFVAPREPELVERWAAAVPEGLNLLVRPHPGTADDATWQEWAPPAGVVVTPAVVRDRAQDLYDQLFASDAVVGLNTSAEIEAAIVGRPVLTVKAGGLAPGQEGSVHFRYLLAGEGGFVRTAGTLEEHVTQLEEALTGDPLAAERQRFLAGFVRPRGLDRPAGPLLADGIEALGKRRGRRLLSRS
jgi:hypothetical protein